MQQAIATAISYIYLLDRRCAQHMHTQSPHVKQLFATCVQCFTWQCHILHDHAIWKELKSNESDCDHILVAIIFYMGYS